jgi:cytochrome c55X
MRRGLELAVLVAAAALGGAAVQAGDPPAARQKELIYLLQQDCGSCHGLTLKGGLGAPLLPDMLAGKADEALVDVILNGVPGTPMPPWRGEISPDEARWLVLQLRNGKGAARVR